MAHRPYKTYKDLIKERAKKYYSHNYTKMTGKTPEEGAHEELEKKLRRPTAKFMVKPISKPFVKIISKNFVKRTK